MKVNRDIEEGLLMRYFSGELSPEEAAKVEQCTMGIINETAADVDTEKALKKVRSRITITKTITKSNQNQNRTKFSYPTFKYIQRIAAVMLLPILSAILYILVKEDHHPVRYITMTTNAGMVSSFTLPDSTTVWLNSGSTLKYPDRFTNGVREVTLEGEAFFDVTKNGKEKFVVTIHDSLSIKVFGTKFNVEAYSGCKNVTATLVEGSIQFAHYDKGHQVLTSLKPAQRLTHNLCNQTTTIKDVAVMPDIAWKCGKIVFDNTSLQDALNILKHHYNVQFAVKDEALNKNHFTGQFEGESLDVILNHLSISTQIKHKRIREEKDEKQKDNEQKDIIELF